VTGRRGPLGRLSTGHWVMLLAGVVAVVLNFAFLRSQQHTVDVAVADVDLVAGSLLNAADVTFTPVHVEESVQQGLVSTADLDPGMVVVRTIPAGTLLSKADLATRSNGKRAMSIPIDREHAVGGLLERGDRVDVVASDSGTARYVLVGAEVLSVSDASGALGTDYSVTLALDADGVLAVAAAMSEGSLEIIRSTGADSPGAMVYPSEP
jgi:pilus assembly protein CpaB